MWNIYRYFICGLFVITGYCHMAPPIVLLDVCINSHFGYFASLYRSMCVRPFCCFIVPMCLSFQDFHFGLGPVYTGVRAFARQLLPPGFCVEIIRTLASCYSRLVGEMCDCQPALSVTCCIYHSFTSLKIV